MGGVHPHDFMHQARRHRVDVMHDIDRAVTADPHWHLILFPGPFLYLYAILPHEVHSYCWFRKKIVAYAKIELTWSAIDDSTTLVIRLLSFPSQVQCIDYEFVLTTNLSSG
jgi:hypothetical protein